jgi:hypothetical protein
MNNTFNLDNGNLKLLNSNFMRQLHAHGGTFHVYLFVYLSICIKFMSTLAFPRSHLPSYRVARAAGRGGVNTLTF